MSYPPKRKPLPASKPVLKPSGAKSYGTRPAALVTPSLSPYNIFQSQGRFANVLQAEPSMSDYGTSLNSGPVKDRPAHSRPKFRQVVPASPTRSKAAVKPEEKMQEFLDNSREDSLPEDPMLYAPLEVKGLVPMLMRHQCRGVRFMASRENSDVYCQGGLLADAMGLGKTIQSIALILNQPAPAEDEHKTTLVVCPLSLTSQWFEEICNMAPKLRVLVHHGTHRTKKARDFLEYDVVITTYHIVTSESPKKRRSAGPLFEIPWYRIIADEAHTFRNQSTDMCAGMLALKTTNNARRWVLTGTPMHNKIDDLETLLLFMGVYSIPIGKTPARIHQVLKEVMLRRSRDVIKKELPEMVNEIRSLKFSSEERHDYESYERMNANLHTKLVRLRQCCNSMFVGDSNNGPRLRAQDEKDKADKMKISMDADADDEDMLSKLLGQMNITTPTKKDGGPEEEPKFPGHNRIKVKALRNILLENTQRKTVVFSTFVMMLRSVEPMLIAEKIRYDVFHGGLSSEQRASMLDRFKDPKEGLTVLLCSLQTAAVGLNLTAASQVVILDPWWNPQIIDQAIMRVHRLGQAKPVRSIHFVVENSVDSRMLEIQEKKRKLTLQCLEGESSKLGKGEIKYLVEGNREQEPRNLLDAYDPGSDDEDIDDEVDDNSNDEVGNESGNESSDDSSAGVGGPVVKVEDPSIKPPMKVNSTPGIPSGPFTAKQLPRFAKRVVSD